MNKIYGYLIFIIFNNIFPLFEYKVFVWARSYFKYKGNFPKLNEIKNKTKN